MHSPDDFFQDLYLECNRKYASLNLKTGLYEIWIKGFRHIPKNRPRKVEIYKKLIQLIDARLEINNMEFSQLEEIILADDVEQLRQYVSDSMYVYK